MRIGTTELRAVITPDCDLVKRADGRSKQPIPLAVKGQLQKLDAPTSQISDLVVLGSKEIRNINWKVGDIQFVDLISSTESPIYRYLGTLKPQYAQDLQKQVLNHIGRVGLEVAPPIAFNALAKAEFMMHGERQGNVPLPFAGAVEACTVIMPRGGDEKVARVIFYRSFYYQLIEALKGVQADRLETLPLHLRRLWGEAINAEGNERLHHELCVTGLEFNEPGECGIIVQKSGTHNSKAFCTIIVNLSKAGLDVVQA